MPGDRRLVVPSAALCGVRAHRLLRLVPVPACAAPCVRCRPSRRDELRARRGLVLGLHCRRRRRRSADGSTAPSAGRPARARTAGAGAGELGEPAERRTGRMATGPVLRGRRRPTEKHAALTTHTALTTTNSQHRSSGKSDGYREVFQRRACVRSKEVTSSWASPSRQSSRRFGRSRMAIVPSLAGGASTVSAV